LLQGFSIHFSPPRNWGGEEVYRQIKELRPDARVLISSGFDPIGNMIESLNQDRDGFLRKPFGLGELSVKVQELLRKG